MSDERTLSKNATWQWQRNYHYLRYAIFGFFLVALGTLPSWLQSEFLSLETVAYVGMSVSILCLIMDIRNYLLYREEERAIRDLLKADAYWKVPIVSLLLAVFYSGMFLLFTELSLRRKVEIVLTEEGSKRMGRPGGVIVSTEKVIHLAGGWTKVRAVDGIGYLLKNEEVKEMKNAK